MKPTIQIFPALLHQMLGYHMPNVTGQTECYIVWLPRQLSTIALLVSLAIQEHQQFAHDFLNVFSFN